MRILLPLLLLTLTLSLKAQPDGLISIGNDRHSGHSGYHIPDSAHPSLKYLLGWIERNHHHEQEPLDVRKIKKVSHANFTSWMHKEYEIPFLVYYQLWEEKLSQPGKFERLDNYPKDSLFKELPADAYEGTGYDHGHLAPARDFKYDETQYHESNLMTNMSPQMPCFNQKGWCYLETQTRLLFTSWPRSKGFVISGPLINKEAGAGFIDSLCFKEHKIMVPAFFYKLIYQENREKNSWRAYAFIVPNSDVNNNEVPHMQVTIDQLEALTGLDFYFNFKDEHEEAFEADFPKLVFTDESDCGRKSCVKVIGKRVTPEKREKKKCQ